MKLRPEPVLIGLLCFGPFLLAALLYFGAFGTRSLPSIDNPERELLAGASTLPALELRWNDGPAAEEPWASYRWALIYVARLPCRDICRAELERLQQVHDALSTDRHRVRRVFLYVGDESPTLDDRSLLLGRLDAQRAALWDELFGGDAGAGAGRFFVADPLGNLVVAYPGGANRSAMLQDFERLLDVSGIG